MYTFASEMVVIIVVTTLSLAKRATIASKAVEEKKCCPGLIVCRDTVYQIMSLVVIFPNRKQNKHGRCAKKTQLPRKGYIIREGKKKRIRKKRMPYII